jgi:hypothetical protein
VAFAKVRISRQPTRGYPPGARWRRNSRLPSGLRWADTSTRTVDSPLGDASMMCVRVSSDCSCLHPATSRKRCQAEKTGNRCFFGLLDLLLERTIDLR